MGAESYSLREVAELLGVSKRELQRRIREGEFPGRFLAPGRHGLETRIPAGDVERVLTQQPAPAAPPAAVDRITRAPRRRFTEGASAGPLVPYEGPGPLSGDEFERLRRAVVEAVRWDRQSLVEAVRGALAERDRELSGIRGQLSALQASVEEIRQRLVRSDANSTVVTSTESTTVEEAEIDALLAELQALEALVGLEN